MVTCPKCEGRRGVQGLYTPEGGKTQAWTKFIACTFCMGGGRVTDAAAKEYQAQAEAREKQGDGE